MAGATKCEAVTNTEQPTTNKRATKVANKLWQTHFFSATPFPSQRKACNLTRMSHTVSSPGLKAISLVCSQSHSFNLQQPSEPLIHLPKMTVTDLSAKQSIYFPLPPLWMYKAQRELKKCQR